MVISSYPSKALAYLAILVFILFLANSSFPETPASAQQKPDALIKEGIELYNGGQFEKAITVLTQLEGLTKDKRLLSDAYFYLSLCYFQLGDKESTRQFIRKTIEVEPTKKIDATKYAPEYYDLFAETQSEVTAVATRQKMPGGGIKWGRIALIGVAVIGVAAAVYFLWIRPETGDIQVNSTPTGAQVYRDGADTGWKTNCTLADISPGDHIIKLVKDGYGDYEQKVTVKRGETATINATLSPIAIRVTKPAKGSTVIKGQICEIKWETGTSSSSRSLQVVGQVFNPANESSYLRRTSAFQARFSLGRLNGESRARSENTKSMSARIARNGTRSPDRVNENLVLSSAKGGNNGPDLPSEIQGIKAWGLYRTNSQASPAKGLNQQGQRATRMGGAEKTNLLDISKVKIELYKGTKLVENVESSTENDGSEDWTVPKTLLDGTDYKIRISCTSDPNIYGESGNFTITAATLKITEPKSTTFWGKGETKDIKWTSPVSGSVRIDLLKGTSPVLPIVDNTANNGSYSWTISPDLEDRMDYRIRISLLTDPNIKGESPSFIITKLTYAIDAVTTGLAGPHGITIDGTGYAHVAEVVANQITRFFPASGPVSPSPTYGAGLSPSLNQPKGIVADPVGGFIYVVDTGNHRILKFDSSQNLVASIGGPTPGSGNGEFNMPYDVAIDNYYNIYVTDTENRRVQKFSSSLTWLDSWSVSGNPLGIACDTSRDRVYVVDFAGKGVLVYSLGGNYDKTWSVQGLPKCIAVDKSGFVYITDIRNHRVLKYTPEGVLLCKMGSYGDAYDQFKIPTDICFDSLGRLLVTSLENNRVQIFK